MSVRQQFDLIIVGGSFAGLCLAAALNRAFADELRIAIVDAGPMSSDATVNAGDARASAIAAASRNLLGAVGIWETIAPHAQAITSIDITDSSLDDGIRPVVLNYENVIAGGDAATYVVENWRLLAALRGAVGSASGVTLFERRTVERFAPAGDGVRVSLSDGVELAARLVVGADGRQSSIRTLAGIKTVDWLYDQRGIVTTVGVEVPHQGKAVQHFLPAGPFAILPLVGARVCVTWSEQADEARRIMALDDDGFLSELERRFGGKLGRLSLAGTRQSWPLGMHLARSLIGERVVLIGDAAHGVHPIAGQGLNLGLRDVAALAEVLADAGRLGQDMGSVTTLELYQRWRRLDSVISAGSFDAINRLFSYDIHLLRTARSAGLGMVDRVPVLKRFFVAEAAGLSGTLPRMLRGEAL